MLFHPEEKLHSIIARGGGSTDHFLALWGHLLLHHSICELVPAEARVKSSCSVLVKPDWNAGSDYHTLPNQILYFFFFFLHPHITWKSHLCVSLEGTQGSQGGMRSRVLMVCVIHWAICKCFAVMTESVKPEILGLSLAKVVLKPIAECLSLFLYPLVGNKSESSSSSLSFHAFASGAGELIWGLKQTETTFLSSQGFETLFYGAVH